MKIFYNFGTAAIYLSLLVPSSVFAAGPFGEATAKLDTLKADTGPYAGTTSSLPNLIGGVINVLLGSLGIIFVIFVVQAGILYMTAGGDPAKVEKAKKMITQNVIGLIIIVAAYAIASFVIGQIQGATLASQPV